MPNKAISYIIGALVVLSSFLAWLTLKKLVLIGGPVNMYFFLFFLSLYVIFLGLSFIIIRKRYFIWIIIAISILLPVFFVGAKAGFLLIVLSCFILVCTSREIIKKDVDNSIRISLSKSLSRGMYLVVIAIALLIASQYYFTVSNLENQEIVPEFTSSKISTEIMSFLLSKVSPEFERVSSENVTVDHFLSEVYDNVLEKQADEAKASLSENERKTLEEMLGSQEISFEIQQGEAKQIVIEEWRESISEQAGYDIKGEEKITDVTIVLLNSKINEFVDEGMGKGEGFNFLPLAFSVALFLALLPIGSFVSRIWNLLAYLIFKLLKKTGTIEIELIKTIVERIK